MPWQCLKEALDYMRDMEILELHLKHFGKFEDHHIRLRPGMNIIYGGNETGKTTIHSFIRSMFFGLSRSKGKAARTDEYQIRQPWDRPGAFLGSMRIREQGKVYRIDRCFDRSTAPLQITCENEAWEAPDPQGTLTALLGGISEAAFVNTVFIPQAHCETDEALAQELQRYMINTDQTGNESIDVTRALQSLRKQKKQYEQKQKKEAELLEEQIENKQAKAERIREELEHLRLQAEQLRAGAAEPYGGRSERTDTAEDYGRMADYDDEELYDEDDLNEPHSKKLKLFLQILLFLAGGFAAAGAIFLEPANVKLFLGIFAAIFFVMILVVQLLLGRSVQSEAAEELQNAFVPPYLLDEIQKHEEAYQTLQRELEELYRNDIKIDGAETEAAALTLAIDRICELSADIYQKNGGKLSETASRILSELTNGRYQKIVLDDTATVRIHTPSRVLGLHQVSGGTMQQIYFALRMAAGELLSNGVELPIVLDETFVMYDDARLESALRWLKDSGRQVILFTCQKRERAIMRRIGEV